MTHTWSQQQLDIYDAVLAAGPGEHLVVLARAGTGKSTTALEAVRRVHEAHPNRAIVYFAFNKVIADDFAPRIAGMGECYTTHAWGNRQVAKAYPRLRVGRRAFGIARRLLGHWDRSARMWVPGELFVRDKTTGGTVSAVAKLVDHAKDALAHDVETVAGLTWRFGLDTTPYDDREAAELALRIMEETANPEGEIDFADMLWLPHRLNLQTQTYQYVFVDEAQDLNPAQLALVQRACDPKRGRIVLIGDDRQAIYQFRGADAEAIPRMTRELNAKTLPLSTTYRCPKSVVEIAQTIVPDYQAAPTAPEGVVEEVSVQRMVAEVQPGDAILSRTNAPLVTHCLALLRLGRRAFIRGRDIGAELRGLVERSKARTVSELVLWLGNWQRRELERLEDAGKNGTLVDKVNDTCETIVSLCEGLDRVDELMTRMERLFEDDTDKLGERILLSSTHRAKGLEWNRVWLLRDTYMRGRKDRMTGRTAAPTVEEQNLYYVGVSRSKGALYLVHERRA